MRVKHLLQHLGRPAMAGLAFWAVACPLSGQSAITTNVNVSDGSNADAFTPNAVTINAGDTVKWIWGGVHNHTSTSEASPPLWNSGSLVNPDTFSFTFINPGSFPYICTIHGFTGLVTVKAAVVTPIVAITSPLNGATFAGPWTGKIQATVSDTNATITKVDFFAGAMLLGTVTNPPANPSLTVTDLAAGNYVLTAVATDSHGATNTPVGVAITVVTPVEIVLSSAQRLSASAFQFAYSAAPGLSYVVLRSGTLPGFTAIDTNKAPRNTVFFLDTSATGAVNFYSVRLLPNP